MRSSCWRALLEGRCGSAERSEQSATARAQLFTRRNCSLRLRTPRMRLRPCMARWLLGTGPWLGLRSSSLLVAPRCSRLQLVVSQAGRQLRLAPLHFRRVSGRSGDETSRSRRVLSYLPVTFARAPWWSRHSLRDPSPSTLALGCAPMNSFGLKVIAIVTLTFASNCASVAKERRATYSRPL